ncbi:hypothetical protein [Phenylobacterium sp.]|jgi:hypothetical protein|uniref:hypothetical protein n=1 Tax=Phenylobacterium sp. TaxID=1871053 RepID=UPI002F95FC10
MRTFECLVTDDRSATPLLTVMLVSDRDRACELASRELLQDVHHTGVELREDGQVIFRALREDLASPQSGPSAGEQRSFLRRLREAD